MKSSKKKAYLHPTLGYAIPPPVPAKVARRNARERNRVKQVNGGFEMLRSHIPSAAKHKKMSKVDTLRHAVEYIQTLQRMLNKNASDFGLDIDLEDESSSADFVKGERVSPPPSAAQNTAEFTSPDLVNHYESGYETSSYYSSSMISPVPARFNQFNSCHHSDVTATQPVYGDRTFFHSPVYQDQTSIEPNSEEDELLDAIANWQDTN